MKPRIYNEISAPFGCSSRSTERLRIETIGVTSWGHGRPGSSRSTERLRIETVKFDLGGLLRAQQPLYGAAED